MSTNEKKDVRILGGSSDRNTYVSVENVIRILNGLRDEIHDIRKDMKNHDGFYKSTLKYNREQLGGVLYGIDQLIDDVLFEKML